ncbi:MAG TPA: hypothetical protein VGF96_19670 [Terracidiphilus sp.]
MRSAVALLLGFVAFSSGAADATIRKLDGRQHGWTPHSRYAILA